MAVSVRHLFGEIDPESTAPDLFFATVVLGVAACEMIGPPLIRRLLVSADEVGQEGERAARRVQQAAAGRDDRDVEGAGGGA